MISSMKQWVLLHWILSVSRRQSSTGRDEASPWSRRCCRRASICSRRERRRPERAGRRGGAGPLEVGPDERAEQPAVVGDFQVDQLTDDDLGAEGSRLAEQLCVEGQATLRRAAGP